jgi:hypothetical protein
MTAEVSLLLIGAAAGVAYCAAHWLMERRRRLSLTARPAIGLPDFMSAISARARVERETAEAVRSAIARALGVPEDYIHAADRFDMEYRLPCQSLLLNEWGEQMVAHVNAYLAVRDCPRLRLRGKRSSMTSVGDLVVAVQDHIESERPRRPERPERGAGTIPAR